MVLCVTLNLPAAEQKKDKPPKIPNLNLKFEKIKKFKALKREERLPELYEKCKRIAHYIPRRSQDTVKFSTLVHAAFTCMNLPEKFDESFAQVDPEDMAALALNYALHDFTINALFVMIATFYAEKFLKKTSIREVLSNGKNKNMLLEVPFPRTIKILKGAAGTIFSGNAAFNSDGDICALETQQYIRFYCPANGKEVYPAIKKTKDFRSIHFSVGDQFLFCEGMGGVLTKYKMDVFGKKGSLESFDTSTPIQSSKNKSKLFKETIKKEGGKNMVPGTLTTTTTPGGLTTTMIIPPLQNAPSSPKFSNKKQTPSSKKKKSSKNLNEFIKQKKPIENILLPPYKDTVIATFTKKCDGKEKKIPYFWNKYLLEFIEPLSNFNEVNPEKSFCILNQNNDGGVWINGKTLKFLKFNNIYSPNTSLLILCAYSLTQKGSKVELKSGWASDAFYQLNPDEQATFCHIFRCKAPTKKTSSMKLEEPIVIKNSPKNSKTPRS